MTQLDDLTSALSALGEATQKILSDLSAAQQRAAAVGQQNQQLQSEIASLQTQVAGLQQQAAVNGAEHDALAQAIGSIVQQTQQLVSGDQTLQASAPAAASPNGNPTPEQTTPAPTDSTATG